MDRRLELLNYLITQERTVSNRELQSVLNLSRRTVINYVNEINSFGDKVIFSSNQGYHCIHSPATRALTQKLEAMQGLDTFDKRCAFLQRELLLRNTHPTLDELADMMFISPATLNNELNRFRARLKEQNLYLKIKNNRLYIIGEEHNKHKLTVSLLSEELEQSHFNLQNLQKFFKYVDIIKIEQTVRRVLNKHSYFMDDFSLLNYVLHLSICTESAMSFPEQTRLYEAVAQNYSFPCHIGDIVEEIYAELKNLYPAEFTLEQILDISRLMATRVVSSDINSLHFEDLEQSIPPAIKELLTVITTSVHDIYGIDLKTDNFMARFAFHLKNLQERVISGISLPQNNFITIKNDYPFLYIIAEYITSIINQKLNTSLSETELSYIALHLGVLMEEKNTFRHTVNCVLVIYDYYTMGISIFEHLKQMTDNIYLTDIVTSYEQIADRENIDLILTTLPVEFSLGIPMIKIHTIPTSQDYEMIIAKVNDLVQNLENEELSRKIRSLFRKELFFPATDFSSWEDTIDFLCKEMESHHYVDAHFKEEIIYHEKIAPSAYRNVALPHSLSNDSPHSDISSIAVAFNTHPIAWADNDVDFVFLLSLRGEDRPLFKDIFRIVSSCLQDAKICESLKKCTSFDTFINILLYQAKTF